MSIQLGRLLAYQPSWLATLNESLLPRLSEMPGFKSNSPHRGRQGRHELDRLLRHTRAGQRVDRVAERWVREEKLETVLPNPRRVTDGEVIVERTKELVGV